MSSTPPSVGRPQLSRTPHSPPSPDLQGRTNKPIKLHHSTSKLESILSSLSDSTNISRHQVDIAQRQLDSLLTSEKSLERENQSLRSSLKEERSSHQVTKKDWEMAQWSVRRLRKENDILLRKYSKVDVELAKEKEKYERAREKLEKEVKDHLTTTKELSRVKEEITLLKAMRRPEVSDPTDEVQQVETDSESMEKENKYLIRKNMDLEIEFENYKQDRSAKTLELINELGRMLGDGGGKDIL
ncbi:hypothetical protein L486_07289 [Kwoniella mangroviensis CBS 10435]|uniref:Uncharacterized protein n=1 Tax=Kwoniella mangroviensis CBS 10435 TaxID=1331196 RepID=A0A1B9IHS7_9TREE|nr:hypothetical protein L486_07289 [Kwoniella mangroviensis CBS 10435]